MTFCFVVSFAGSRMCSPVYCCCNLVVYVAVDQLSAVFLRDLNGTQAGGECHSNHVCDLDLVDRPSLTGLVGGHTRYGPAINSDSRESVFETFNLFIADSNVVYHAQIAFLKGTEWLILPNVNSPTNPPIYSRLQIARDDGLTSRFLVSLFENQQSW